MIIIMQDSFTNKQYANLIIKKYELLDRVYVYPFDFSYDVNVSAQDKKLIIIDLEKENILQLRQSSKLFTHELLRIGIPKKLTDVYFIVSDIHSVSKTVSFINYLASDLSAIYKRKILVHAPFQLNFEKIHIEVPLTEMESWRVHGVSSDKKTIIWQGEDILKWLNDSNRTLSGVDYVWE